jgi:porphobilinogen synthase
VPEESEGATWTSPRTKLRRLRRNGTMREWLAESRFDAQRTAWPVYLHPGVKVREKIDSLPGFYRYSVDEAVRAIGEAHAAGVPAVVLFGQSGHRDPRGKESYNPEGPVPRCVRELKRLWPSLVVVTDVCLCSYTNHGHCGVWKDGAIDTAATLSVLQKAALAYGQAGADFVAPSTVLDHQVAHLRETLDGAGCTDTGIIASSATFSSALYGPGRLARGAVLPEDGGLDQRLDPRNGRAALRQIELDVSEGADIIMVRPALPSLDVIARARDRFHVPIAATQTGGEYAMLKAAADRGWVDLKTAALESLTAIHRSGADLIVTPFALSLIRWERERVE